MSATDTGRTIVDAAFAGRQRRFCLRIGEMGELERITGHGIGAIFMRLGTHSFGVAEVWDTIRLGLEGGGTPAIEATALVMNHQSQPLMDFLPLAGKIVAAAVNGFDPEEETARPGKAEAEGSASDPVTSPSTMPPGPSSDGPPNRSTA